MIPKRIILDRARAQGLRDTIVEKDYVLGWVLHAVVANEDLCRWVFKGGTCLKKCFFGRGVD
jgi:predicted nucleotidyltransferase component of viral defense system